MRLVKLISLLLLCTGCSLAPFEIQQAPLKPNLAVVFDIDGTLTPKPFSIYKARDHAATAVNQFSSRGYKIIYLSARITLFQKNIPGWLKQNGFPEGSIHVPQSSQDSDDHQAFKQQILNKYKDKGWKFVAAYGDSSTDFNAYAAAGIDQQFIFALKRKDEGACQPGPWIECFDHWSEQMELIQKLIQP